MGSLVFVLFRAVVGVLLDPGLIINPEAVQTRLQCTHTRKGVLCCSKRGDGEEGD